MSKRKMCVDVNTIADMSACIEVEVDDENKTEEEILNEAEELAVNQAKSGNVEWQYDGIVESEEYTVAGVS